MRTGEDAHIENLMSQVEDMQKVKDMQETPGWKLVERVFLDYKERTYREFLDGDLDGVQYRADCMALEYLLGVSSILIEQGEAAAKELKARGANLDPETT